MGLYSKIVDLIDVDAFEEAIGFFPEETKDDNDIGQCPDLWGLHKHGDTTGKFAIHRRKRVYNCWVCGGGTLLSLAMQVKQCSEDEGLDFLQEFVGEHRTDDEFIAEIDALLNEDERKRDPILPWFNERVLTGMKLACDHPWFEERGISEKTIEHHGLGYGAELTKKNKKGEYTGPGIILPHRWGGKLVGWQTRWLDDDRPKWVAKYTNTHDFPRTHTLFNFESVYFSTEPIVVVESVSTTLFLESLGVSAVSTFGSNVTDDQIKLLRRCQQGVILAPDNDAPGRKFVTQLGDALERFIDVKVAPFVDGEAADLGDLVQEPELVIPALESAAYR